MRQIEGLNLPNVTPARITSAPPTFLHVSPDRLRIDERYQRGLTAKSVALIERIVSQWDWRAFKPPVVVQSGEVFEVIDGQHTAIAALTHPRIAEIPVMVVSAEAVEQRADAFVRHNRDRIAVSGLELHFAQLAAGDETAQTIAQVCERSGVNLLRMPPPLGRYKPGDCMAISSIRTLVNRRHARGARRVLETAVKGQAAPVTAALLKAIDCLLFDREYAGEISEADISSILLGGHDLTATAERFAVERKLPHWRGLASVIWMKKGRRRG